MDAEKVEKVCIGLDRHKDGICQAKDGSICPYWETGSRCSRVMMDDALSVIRELKSENERLRQEKTDALKQVKALDIPCVEIRSYKAYMQGFSDAITKVIDIINEP